MQSRISNAPFFFVSLDGKSFDQLWHPRLGGLFRAPIPVYYKASFEQADIISAICGNSMENGSPSFPIGVKEAMSGLLEASSLKWFDFYWIVTDVSKLIGLYGHELNLSHHGWYFPDSLFSKPKGIKRFEANLQAGIFSYKGSQVFRKAP